MISKQDIDGSRLLIRKGRKDKYIIVPHELIEHNSAMSKMKNKKKTTIKYQDTNSMNNQIRKKRKQILLILKTVK